MLATLNLQLLPAELPDENLHTAPLLTPGGEAVAPEGFANLLRLRVDESIVLPTDAGELLPLGGSELPLEPDALLAQLPGDLAAALPTGEPLEPILVPTALPALSGTPLTGADSGNADISIAAEILYTPGALNPLAATPSAALPVAPVVSSTPAVTPTIGDESILSSPGAARALPLGDRPLVTQPLPLAETTIREPMAANVNRADVTSLAAMPSERPQVIAARVPAAADLDRSAPLPELPLRPAVTATAERGDAIAQELAPLLRARPVVAQPAQVLNGQLNLQQPPPIPVAPLAPSAVVSDLSYSAAAQQATDLIGTSVRDSIWGERVGERVVMMASQQLKSAEIRLTPAELGPLRVQVALDDGATNVTFHAQHAVTRDALEQALPRLREMLAENGLTLGNAEVGDDGVRQGSHDAEADAATSTVSGSESVDGSVDRGPLAERQTTVSRGLVDTFA